jgi:hypothetical protein
VWLRPPRPQPLPSRTHSLCRPPAAAQASCSAPSWCARIRGAASAASPRALSPHVQRRPRTSPARPRPPQPPQPPPPNPPGALPHFQALRRPPPRAAPLPRDPADRRARRRRNRGRVHDAAGAPAARCPRRCRVCGACGAPPAALPRPLLRDPPRAPAPCVPTLAPPRRRSSRRCGSRSRRCCGPSTSCASGPRRVVGGAGNGGSARGPASTGPRLDKRAARAATRAEPPPPPQTQLRHPFPPLKATCIVSHVLVMDTLLPFLVPLRFSILAALVPKAILA